MTLATALIDWDMMAGCVEMEGNRLLFAKIRDDAVIAVPESKYALCYAPMLITNPKQPLVRGGLAKKYMADLLGIPYVKVQPHVTQLLIQATSRQQKEGAADRAKVIEAMLPFDSEVVYNGGDTPAILHQYGAPGWVLEVLEYQKLYLGWVNMLEVIQTGIPKSLEVIDKPYDDESWILATTHNLQETLITLLEHHGFALRQKKRPTRRSRCKPNPTPIRG
jgi:hypothetical protein